jgi:hypothetical protein
VTKCFSVGIARIRIEIFDICYDWGLPLGRQHGIAGLESRRHLAVASICSLVAGYGRVLEGPQFGAIEMMFR